MTSADIAELAGYHGAEPAPSDFDAFWAMRMEEADAVPLVWRTEPADVGAFDGCEYFDLWFRGMGGARLYAKYVRPRSDGPLPLVLQFHGYPGASRSWFEQSSFAGMGCALVAFDNPGQGGRSQDIGGFCGTTVAGHLVAGADGPTENLYYVRLYQDVRILCRIVVAMGEGGAFDLERIFVNGASQGGGMGIACCALNPGLVNRAAILYPFLSDFRRVSELGADEIAYEGLRYWSRWFDPDGTRSDALFDKLAYVDTKNFAHLVRCPVQFGTGLADTICPPETQCAVYNGLACEKVRHLYPGMGHEEIQAFDDETLAFFGRVVEGGNNDVDDGGTTAPNRDVAALLRGASATRLDLGNVHAAYYELGIPAPEGGTLVARYVTPVQGGPHPLVLMFHDLGRGVRGWHHLTRFVAPGFAVLHLQNRAAIGVASFDHAVADAVAAFDVAIRLPGIDTAHIVTFGEGFGGALALAVATTRNVSKVVALNPYPTAILADAAAGVGCPVLLGSSGMDELAPACDQDRLAEGLSKVTHRRYPKYAHERVNAFEDEFLRFLRGSTASHSESDSKREF